MIAYQILDLFASPSDSILADTLALAQRYPQDEPRPQVELLPRCKDGTFARVCSATWVFSRGFVALVCFFVFSWVLVFLGRCGIDDSGIIADPQASLRIKLESRESSKASDLPDVKSSPVGAAAASGRGLEGKDESTDPRVDYDDELDAGAKQRQG